MLFFILWTKEIREADERNKNYNLTKSHLIGEKATRQEGPEGMSKLQRTAFLNSFCLHFKRKLKKQQCFDGNRKPKDALFWTAPVEATPMYLKD